MPLQNIKTPVQIPENIYLIGMMGSWKSTVGKRLADNLNVSFTDTDNSVEEKAELSVGAIFSEKGSEYFRMLESEIIKETANQPPHVIATGGGAVLYECNRTVFQKYGLTIYLKATPAVLAKRIRNVGRRPILQKEKDPLRKIETILQERKHLYDTVSDIIIDTDGSDPFAVRKMIIQCLKEKYGDNIG
ncbi:shikimate kinase [Candidatus Neomarinimicrobiota bacterium]